MGKFKTTLFIMGVVAVNLSTENALANNQSAGDIKNMKNTFQSFLKCADQGKDYLEVRKCRKPLVDSKMQDVIIDRYLGINSNYIKASSLTECPLKTETRQKKHDPEVTNMLCFPSQFSANGHSSVLFKKEKELKIIEILL